MKTWIGVLLVIATIVAPPVAAKALLPADGTMNDITITVANPVPNGAKVQGSYKLALGYTFSSITVNVRPANDVAGEGGEGVATTGRENNFSASISGVPAGVYDIQATLIVMDGNGTPYYFFSTAVMNVTIPAKR